MDIFLEEAYKEALKGLEEGGIPIGSVLVREGQIIGRGHNRRIQLGDPVAHAEIDCLRNAGRIVNYKNSILYSTLMPCFLCAGAIVQFGIKKVVVGEARNFSGAEVFLKSNGVDVFNADDKKCYEIMKDFIEQNPGIWNEDIGK